MKRKFVLLLFLFVPLIMQASALEFYDGFMYSELKGRYSKNTNFPHKLNEVFQQIEMKMRLNVTTNIEGYAFFKTQYSAFHAKKDDRLFLLNSMGVKYKFNPATELKLGSMLVNYSPYIISAPVWAADVFRGIEFKLDRSDLTVQAFVANNGEDPDEGGWIEGSPLFTTNLDYRYNTIDLGYDKNGVRQDYPTIWGGCHFRKAFKRNNMFSPEVGLYYLFENYQIENDTALWALASKNHIGGINLNSKLINWLNINCLYAAMLQNSDLYIIQKDYFDEDKDYYKLYESKQKKDPDAIVLEGRIDDFWGKMFGVNNLSIQYLYEAIHRYYNPVYMDSNSFNRRSLSLPIDFNVSGRTRNAVVIMQDLFGSMTQEHIKTGLSLGYGFSRYIIDYRVIEDNTRPSPYLGFINEGKNFTIIENSIRVSLVFSKMLRLQGKYYFNKVSKAKFPDGGEKIDFFHVSLDSDILDNVFVQVEYGQNLNYYKNYDQLLVKLMIWGW